jgi:flagellar basal-body rod protein FlgB
VVSPISDITTVTLRVALDGLDQRQQAIASNIANLETPGYLAREVDFESSLRAALLLGEPESTSISIDRSLAPTRLNGNNVNIDNEISRSTETQLRQQLAIEGLNSKYRLLRTAITGH